MAVLEPIGRLESVYDDLSRVPSQASESDGTARIVMEERYADGLLGLDRYHFIWVLTWLHEEAGEPPLRLVPRATEATGEIQGVFASRAPARPNAIGLSLVRLLGIEGTVLTAGGVDLLDGTPVLDIKPWFPGRDLPPVVHG